MVFSPPKVAAVKEEDMLKATISALKEKYPDNYFVAAYHDETDNPHVHVVLNIHKNTGEKINIKKEDLRDIREGYCKNLLKYGYDVKATRKYVDRPKECEELVSQDNRNIYEVVDFGTASYQLNRRNDNNSYLVYKTSNNKEVTIWGKEILGEMTDKNIKKGDFIRIEKTGYVDVRVPIYAADKATVISWKEAKRNQWNIEKTGDNSNFSKPKYPKEIKLDSPEQAAKQLKQKEKFDHEKSSC